MWPKVWPGVRRQRTWMAPNCSRGAGEVVGPRLSPRPSRTRAHPQLLAVCQPARQCTDALVRTQHHQTRQQPHQFRVAASMVPEDG